MTDAQQALCDRLRTLGSVQDDVVRVERFLNHCVDLELLRLVAIDFARQFRQLAPDAVITSEASGIVVAHATALELGCPYIYARKSQPRTMEQAFSAPCYSFTRRENVRLYVSSDVLQPGMRVLFVDDFCAQGAALRALQQIVEQAGAQMVGQAVVIDKSRREDIYAIARHQDLQAWFEAAGKK